MNSSASMRTFLIVALNEEIGEQVKQALHGTGKPLLALDIVTDLANLSGYADSWKPQVLVADSRLKIDIEGCTVPVVKFNPLAFDVETLSNRIMQPPASTPVAPSSPTISKQPAHGIAVGFQGVKGGVGTTTVVAGMAEAAVQSGYRAAILDLAGDCAITLRAQADEQDGHLYLTDKGIKSEPILKMHEGRPNISDAIMNGEIQLVVNTPSGKTSQYDDSYIRKAAIKYKVPYITTLAAAAAAARGIAAFKKGEKTVKSLQSYHADIK